MRSLLLLLSCTAIVLLFTASPPLGASQEKQPPLASSVSADPFIGTWRLNTDKSSRSGIEKESITIESWGNEFKFLVDSLGENGAHLHYWFVTDMKGGAAKHTQVDGRPMSSESRITRLDSNRFVNDTAILKDEYRVSADSQTLTVHRTFKLRGTNLPKQKLVFERVQGLIK